MKCLKCNGDVPRRIWIDGKLRNLQHRKYCIVCSPFGKHNTRKIICKNSGEKINKQCRRCKKDLISNRRNFCDTCNTTLLRKKKKDILVKYKGGKCIRCGYDKCLDALIFHHRNPLIKEFSISSNIDKAISTLKREVDKCDLICGNCHAEEHSVNF